MIRERIDVASLLDKAPFGRFMTILVAMAASVLVLDGYDAIALAVSAPSIMAAHHFGPASFGSVLGVGQIGVILGTSQFGSLADRIGRKPTILIAIAIFSAFTLATPIATSLEQLLAIRFLAGLGIGGVKPPLVALVSDYAPAKWRVSAVTIVSAGYGLGTLVVSVASIFVLSYYDWRLLFWIGGVAPIAVAVTLAILLPESARFLVNATRPDAQVATALAAVDPDFAWSHPVEFYLGDESGRRQKRTSLAAIFEGDFRWMTPLLWLCFLANGATFFFVGNWVPTLVRAAGGTAATAGMSLACFSLGGVVGGLLFMRIVDRFGTKPLVLAPLTACVVIGALGFIGVRSPAFPLALFIGGVCMMGANYSMIGVTARLYPSGVRATGSGWVAAMSGIASVAGPWIGGFVIGANTSVEQIFLTAAAPLPLFALSIYILSRTGLSHDRSPEAPSAQEATLSGIEG